MIPRPQVRGLVTGPVFWLAMLAASALGTNLGDFAVDDAGFDRGTSFALLALLCALAVLADRWANGSRRWRTEMFYWVAIVLLRAAATNVADAVTHDLTLGYLLPTAILGVLALVAGTQTRAPVAGWNSPLINGWYWVAMLLAGIFGTTCGDMIEHTTGMGVAAAGLTTVLVLVLIARARLAPTAMLAYWCVVLAERCAGTPLGDGLAGRHGLAIGLPASMTCTGVACLLTLLWREALRRRRAGAAVPAAA